MSETRTEKALQHSKMVIERLIDQRIQVLGEHETVCMMHLFFKLSLQWFFCAQLDHCGTEMRDAWCGVTMKFTQCNYKYILI